MIRKKITAPVYLLLWVFVCFTKISGQTESRFALGTGQKIAVLDFEQEGNFGSSKFSVFSADEMTTALYIKRNLKVIDRAHIRAVIADKNISPTKLTNQQLHDLGEVIGAELIVLGKIVFLQDGTIVPGGNEKNSVEITIRILSSTDGSVVGMVQRRFKKKGNMETLIRDSVWKMAGEIELN
jgi:hypothetical protein